MRKTTRKQYYGRSAIAGSLSSAINDLSKAIKLAQEPAPSPISEAIKQVAVNLERAAKSFDVYGVKRKRLQNELLKEMENLQELLQQVRGIPVFPDEKAIAKHSHSTKEKR